MNTKGDKSPGNLIQPQGTSVSSVSAVATMPDDQVRVLIGLVEGHSAVFQVKVPSNKSVLYLMKLVWEEKKKGALRDVDASDLILLKVSTF